MLKKIESGAHPFQDNPVLAELKRADHAESVHHGRAAIVDISGSVQFSAGNIMLQVYPRSCAKIIQFLPAMLSGAAKSFEFTDPQIALACASHHGTDRHYDQALAMLKSCDISPELLACGDEWPMIDRVKLEFAAAGGKPNPVTHMCSGKHSAMLAQAKYMNVSLEDYYKVTHPVQQRIMGTIERLMDIDLSDAPQGIDGCNVPTWAVPLGNIAYGFARIGVPESLPDDWQLALDKIKDCIAQYPDMVSGQGGYITRLMQVFGKKLYIKDGAEGVMCASLPEYGLGVAVKCDDGSVRGAQAIMTAMLTRIGLFDDLSSEARDQLQDILSVELNTSKFKAAAQITSCNC
ncbi:MAG: asparaginase [Alphaproteobacteria bacterium]